MLHTSREQIYTSREQIYTSREQLRISREELTSSREQISSTAEERLSSSVDELRTSGVNFSGSDPPTAEEKLDIRPDGFRWVTMSTCVVYRYRALTVGSYDIPYIQKDRDLRI